MGKMERFAFVALVAGIYLFLAKTSSQTFFGEFLHEAVISKAALKQEKDAEYQRLIDEEFGDEE